MKINIEVHFRNSENIITLAMDMNPSDIQSMLNMLGEKISNRCGTWTPASSELGLGFLINLADVSALIVTPTPGSTTPIRPARSQGIQGQS